VKGIEEYLGGIMENGFGGDGGELSRKFKWKTAKSSVENLDENHVSKLFQFHEES
jgi:hypothetical protein